MPNRPRIGFSRLLLRPPECGGGGGARDSAQLPHPPENSGSRFRCLRRPGRGGKPRDPETKRGDGPSKSWASWSATRPPLRDQTTPPTHGSALGIQPPRPLAPSAQVQTRPMPQGGRVRVCTKRNETFGCSSACITRIRIVPLKFNLMLSRTSVLVKSEVWPQNREAATKGRGLKEEASPGQAGVSHMGSMVRAAQSAEPYCVHHY